MSYPSNLFRSFRPLAKTFAPIGLACLFIMGAGLIVAPGHVRAETAPATGIALVVDGRVVVPDVPPQLRDGRTMVPLRFVGEALGFDVTWDAQAQRVTLKTPARQVTLVINSRMARVDGTYQFLDVPPQLLSGRTMVPLRFVAESLGLAVSWQASSQTVNIDPAPPDSGPTQSASDQSIHVDMAQLPIGETLSDVLAGWGSPQAKYPGFYGVEHWVYRPAPDQLLVLDFRGERLVAGYGLGAGWSYKGADASLSPTGVRQELGITDSMTLRLGSARYAFDCQRSGPWGVLPAWYDAAHVVLFYEDTVDDRVPAVLVIDPQEFMKDSPLSRSGCSVTYNTANPPPATPTLGDSRQADAEVGEARLLLDLVNTERALRDLPLLSWNATAATVAVRHSRDMVLNAFFSHVSPTTGSPADRLKAAGFEAIGYGENIAQGYADAIATHHAWMNSPGHRANVLQPGFRELGVGSYGLTFTEDFVVTH